MVWEMTPASAFFNHLYFSQIYATSFLGLAINPLQQVATGLFPYSNHVFRVKAHSPLNGGSFGPYSTNSSLIQTSQSCLCYLSALFSWYSQCFYIADAATVTNLWFQSRTSRSITFSWNAPIRPRGFITQVNMVMFFTCFEFYHLFTV